MTSGSRVVRGRPPVWRPVQIVTSRLGKKTAMPAEKMNDCHRRFPVTGQYLNSWRLNFFNFYYKVKTLEGDFELSLALWQFFWTSLYCIIKISLSPGGKFTEKWLAFVVRFFVVRPIQSRFPQSRALTESTLFRFFSSAESLFKKDGSKKLRQFRESCYFRLWHWWDWSVFEDRSTWVSPCRNMERIGRREFDWVWKLCLARFLIIMHDSQAWA